MPSVTYIETAGAEKTVEVPDGESVMRGACNNGIEGIRAECGGVLSCATCHVYIDPAWIERVGPRGEMEEAMMDFAFDVHPESRLSCQVKVTPALDGLVVRMPLRQA